MCALALFLSFALAGLVKTVTAFLLILGFLPAGATATVVVVVLAVVGVLVVEAEADVSTSSSTAVRFAGRTLTFSAATFSLSTSAS